MTRASFTAAGLATLATLAAASGQDDKPKVLDDVNPRATSTPLQIELEPWWCPDCAKAKTIEDQARPVPVMRRTAPELAELLGIQDDWFAIETPHYRIFSTLRGTTSKFDDGTYCRRDLERLRDLVPGVSFGPEGAKLDAHQRAHLYHVRLERQYAHFSALTGNKQPNLGMPERYEVMLFANYSQHHAFCDRFIGGRQDKGGVQWHFQDKPNYIIFTTAEDIVAQKTAKGDGALANHVFHNNAHNLVDGFNNYFRETPAFIEEGLGHYYERRENPRWNNFCWAEGKAPTDFTKPDWEATILTLLRRGKDTPFAEWCERLQPGELTGIENGFTWGVVTWLIETEPVRFTKMLEPMDDLKRNLTSAQLIEEGFGVSPSVLYQRWRDWVIENWSGK